MQKWGTLNENVRQVHSFTREPKLSGWTTVNNLKKQKSSLQNNGYSLTFKCNHSLLNTKVFPVKFLIQCSKLKFFQNGPLVIYNNVWRSPEKKKTHEDVRRWSKWLSNIKFGGTCHMRLNNHVASLGKKVN